MIIQVGSHRHIARLALLAAILLAVTAEPARAESAYAPDESGEQLARLRLRCHLSLTCPLDRKSYALFQRALAGDRAAEVQFGEKLDRGEGVPVDRVGAAVWFARAAEAGFVRAALDLNRLFRAGVPLHCDDAAILAALRPQADAGNPDATRAIADMIFYGRGAPADPRAALTLLRRAAAGGSPAATADLARLQQASPGGVVR